MLFSSSNDLNGIGEIRHIIDNPKHEFRSNKVIKNWELFSSCNYAIKTTYISFIRTC